MNHDDYQELLDRFLDGELSSPEFQHRYLEKIKKESRNLPENFFRVLDDLFADVDAFCADTGLLAQLNSSNPDYLLDERTLRQRVSEASRLLREIANTRAQARAL